MTTFSTHLTFAKTALREACDCLHGELFAADTVCIERLDRQLSQFVMLLLTLAAMLGMASLRNLIRM